MVKIPFPGDAKTGGCQCGAVRYAITSPFENPHICHCRMCQKAFGNYFAALVGTMKTGLTWTKGTPGFFRSSAIVDRGFCRECGTPLSIADDDSDRIAVSIGSLDHRSAAGRLRYSAQLAGNPNRGRHPLGEDGEAQEPPAPGPGLAFPPNPVMAVQRPGHDGPGKFACSKFKFRH